MFDDAAYRIVQLEKIGPRQLQLPVFVAVAIKYFRLVVVAAGLVNKLSVSVHDHKLVIGILGNIVDLQKVVNAVAVW